MAGFFRGANPVSCGGQQRNAPSNGWDQGCCPAPREASARVVAGKCYTESAPLYL